MRPHDIAMTYLGVPFQHRGRTRQGVDCLGLLVLVAIEYGNTVFDKAIYGREPWRDGLRDGLRAHCGPPVKRPFEIDDILLMRLNPGEEPSHVAIVAPHPYGLGMIHTYAEVNRVVYHRIDKYRRRQIVEVFAWPDPS